MAKNAALKACISAGLSLAALTGCAPSGDVPTTSATSAAETDNPWTQVVACLDDAGFPGFVVTVDGIQAPQGITDAQIEVVGAAVVSCQEQARLYTGPIPEDELPRLYDLELEARECLIELGFEMPEPPSLQSYIDSGIDEARWEAFYDAFNSLPLADQTEDRYIALRTDCPPPSGRFTRE